MHHVWDTTTYKVITGFVWNFYQRRVSDHGIGHCIMLMIRIAIRIQVGYWAFDKPRVEK